MASGTPTDYVRKHDLQPEVSEDSAHTMVGKQMSTFIKNTVNG